MEKLRANVSFTIATRVSFLFSLGKKSRPRSVIPIVSKNLGANRIRNCQRQIAPAHDRLAFDVNSGRAVIEGERQRVDKSNRAHAGNAPALVHVARSKKARAFRVIVTLQTEIEGKRDGIFRIESGPHPLGGLQTAHDQARADQQDERERDLRDDERIAQTRAAKPSHRAFVFQRRDSSGFEDWSAGIRLKITPVRNREGERENDDAPIDAQIEKQRDVESAV